MKNKKKIIGLLLSFISMAILIVIVLIVTAPKNEIYKFKEDAYIVQFENVIDVPSSTEIRHLEEKNDSIFVSVDDIKTVVDEFPFYFYSNNPKMLTIKDMVYIEPYRETYNSGFFNMLTSIEYVDGKYVFSLNDDYAIKEHGFIYDYDDTYIILDEVTLEQDDGKLIILPAFTTIIVKDGSYYQYYNPVTKEYHKEDYTGSLYIHDALHTYIYNLNNAFFLYEDGSVYYLMKMYDSAFYDLLFTKNS